MSDLNNLIEQAKGMDDPAKIIEVFKACGLDISEAEAKAFVDTQELPNSVMDAIAGGAKRPVGCMVCGAAVACVGGVWECPNCHWKVGSVGCPKCGAPLEYLEGSLLRCTSGTCTYSFECCL